MGTHLFVHHCVIWASAMWAHLLQVRVTRPEGSVLGLCPCALRWMDAGSHVLPSTHTAHHRGAREVLYGTEHNQASSLSIGSWPTWESFQTASYPPKM